ncbi:Splicing factor 3b subunit 4 [Scedosporium apiospermum]|uniref:Splicing factor 3b subunit 4 n=1 Tax=Pseudallescheria apiosperma TaxID=563466 RepID=A0A084FX56_PSEDA|nr:Splicing factor 3b subunit 4 [Scedosporium apiospermum]KEZ39668.1 Splicing factor 3b subunit 4 [Scedosporium apiospermum]
MAQNRHWEQDKDATVYIGNIDERADPAMVYEIMLQMGPIHNIHMPRDRVTQNHQGFGFVEFRTPLDAEYAANVMNGVKLYGKSLRVNKASADKQKQAEVGAELYIGNLDPGVDEKLLYDTFSRFGPLLSIPKVARDDSAQSKGFGFVSYADFESSDAAIANLNGQYILSKEVSVQYAFKKDGRGERHGDDAERELAKQAKKRNLVPEAAAIPAAFLNAPPAAPAPAAVPQIPSRLPAAAPAAGFDASSMPSAPGIPAGMPPPRIPAGFNVPSRGGPPPPGFPAPIPGHPQAIPPHGLQAGRGATVLPPAPSGLPARPPQGQRGYTNPADFHPGSYRTPPPGGAAAPPPPPGFTPPPGFGPPGTAPGAPPGAPPGFMPPPPGFQPPPGFSRR